MDLYYLNDSIFLNDRIAHSSTSAITSSHIIAVPRSTLKAKVGITPIPRHNSNFSYNIIITTGRAGGMHRPP